MLRGALQGKDWCWSGTDCKGRSVPSGSAEQRARAFITVTGGGGGGWGQRRHWTSPAHQRPCSRFCATGGNACPARGRCQGHRKGGSRPLIARALCSRQARPRLRVGHTAACKSRFSSLSGRRGGSEVMLDADEMSTYLCGARALIPFPGLGFSVPRWLFSHGELTPVNASWGHQVSEGQFFLTFYFVLGYSRLTNKCSDSFRWAAKELILAYTYIQPPPNSPPIQPVKGNILKSNTKKYDFCVILYRYIWHPSLKSKVCFRINNKHPLEIILMYSHIF